MPDGDLDGGAVRGVPQGVGDEVGHHLAQPGLGARTTVGADRAVEAEQRDASLRRPHAGVGDGIRREHGEVDLAASTTGFVVDPGQGEQVLDEAAHPGRLGLDALHRAGRRPPVGDGALPVQLGVAAHRGERGAQLVRGVGDELAHPLLAGLAHGEGRTRSGRASTLRLRESEVTSSSAWRTGMRRVRSPVAIAAAVSSMRVSGTEGPPHGVPAERGPTR